MRPVRAVPHLVALGGDSLEHPEAAARAPNEMNDHRRLDIVECRYIRLAGGRLHAQIPAYLDEG